MEATVQQTLIHKALAKFDSITSKKQKRSFYKQFKEGIIKVVISFILLLRFILGIFDPYLEIQLCQSSHANDLN